MNDTFRSSITSFEGAFGRANDRRSGAAGSEFPNREGAVLVGGGVPGKRRERRGIAKHALSQGEPPNAAASESGGSSGGQGERKHIRNDVSAVAAATGIQTGHLGHRPSALPTALADSAQGGALRGTGSGGELQVEAHAGYPNDQGTPKARLSRRARTVSGGKSGVSTWFFSTLSRFDGYRNHLRSRF